MNSHFVQLVYKDVALAKYSTEQSEKDHFKKFSWSSLEEAVTKTKHCREKEILNEAYTYINDHPRECRGS